MNVPEGLKAWAKLTPLRKLWEKRGKWYGSLRFRNPTTGETSEYWLFGQDDCVLILAVTATGNVQVVYEFKHAVSLLDEPALCGGIIAGLPAGTAQSGAHMNLADLAKARLERETGYGEARSVERLGSLFGFTRHCPTRAHGFLHLGVRKVCSSRKRPGEEMETRSIPLEEWLVMTFTKVVDGLAIATTHQAIPVLMEQGLLTPETFARACSRAMEIRRTQAA